MKSANEKFILNGALNIDWPRKFSAVNTIFTYDRPIDGPEELIAIGPTSEELIILVRTELLLFLHIA